MHEREYFVYILTNKRRTVLYIGVTGNLVRRIAEHKAKVHAGFAAKYNVTELIYAEVFESPQCAIEREKQLKGWNKSKKERLIAQVNPNWRTEELKI